MGVSLAGAERVNALTEERIVLDDGFQVGLVLEDLVVRFETLQLVHSRCLPASRPSVSSSAVSDDPPTSGPTSRLI